jgi:hypothetical protein
VSVHAVEVHVEKLASSLWAMAREPRISRIVEGSFCSEHTYAVGEYNRKMNSDMGSRQCRKIVEECEQAAEVKEGQKVN